MNEHNNKIRLQSEKQIVKTTRRVIALAIMCVGINSTVLAQPPHKKTLAGTWDLRVTVEHMPGTISAVSICKPDSDLTYVQADENRLVYGQGTWISIGKSEFRLMFVTQTNDKAGARTGSLQVQGTADLRSDDVLTGTAVVQSVNEQGKLVYSGTAKVEGNRVHTSSRLTAMR
jgi:hypothetical protein